METKLFKDEKDKVIKRGGRMLNFIKEIFELTESIHKKKSFSELLFVMFSVALIFSLSSFVSRKDFSGVGLKNSLTLFIILSLVILLSAYFFELGFYIFGRKPSYFNSLLALTSGLGVISISSLTATFISLIPHSSYSAWGLLLSLAVGLILLWGVITGTFITIKLFKEFFKSDLLEVFIIFIVLVWTASIILSLLLAAFMSSYFLSSMV